MDRKPVILGATAVVAVAAAGAIFTMWEPAIIPVKSPSPLSIEPALRMEGARAVALGDCIVCHTATGGRPFAGGLPLVTPFGTIYSTNITPDEASGIGTWTLEAFERAMRRGISRDGHQLYPAFPYIHYASITEREITATYAYLMSREPVYSVVPNNQLMFPLGFRPLISFWNTIYLDKERTHSDPTQSAEWNRGRALVDGLGHCSACHTPLNLIGGERSGRALYGGVIDGWDAYPLNKLLHGTSPWTQKELVTYLRTGLSSEHGAAAGPMFAVTQELSMVPEEDVRAIAKYIMAIQRPPPSAAILVSNPDAGDIASVARGATLFAGACAACHDAASPMQMIAHRPSLASSSAVSANSPRNTIQMILEGMPWHAPNAGPYMPRFADQLTNTQIADLANYLRATQTRRPPWSEVTEIVAEVRKENEAR